MMNTEVKKHYSITKQPVILSSVGKVATTIVGEDVGIYAVMPNVFDVMYEDYLDVSHKNRESGLSIAEQLYTPQGSQSVIVSESIYK